MTRWRISIEYDGGEFVGWQRQDNGRSVQQTIEEAIFKFSNEKVSIYGAGRTDSGVHALGQVAHFDLVKCLDERRVRDALNFYLKPHLITILDVGEVDNEFHARFSATGRHYQYRILNRRAPPAVDRGQVWHIPEHLDWQAMNNAGKFLIGRHDFSSFRSAKCQSDTAIKTLDALSVHRHMEQIIIDTRARSFLHNQVRIMVGTLRMVGIGKWSAIDVKKLLASCDRGQAGITAPPCGLYLTRIDYA